MNLTVACISLPFNALAAFLLFKVHGWVYRVLAYVSVAFAFVNLLTIWRAYA